MVFIAIAVATAGATVAGAVLTLGRRRRAQQSVLRFTDSRPLPADGTGPVLSPNKE